MTRLDRMIYWFRARNGQASLGEILRSGELWVHKMSARMQDAKKKGIQFTCQQDRDTPSNNIYRMIEQNQQPNLL